MISGEVLKYRTGFGFGMPEGYGEAGSRLSRVPLTPTIVALHAVETDIRGLDPDARSGPIVKDLRP
jgi:hypothetical protein